MQYTLAHDDGQLSNELNDAEIILIGVSRTSKTPTSTTSVSSTSQASSTSKQPTPPTSLSSQLLQKELLDRGVPKKRIEYSKIKHLQKSKIVHE